MLSKAEIGRILGLTREQARVLVLKGCPRTTEAEVVAWREANPPRRAPTNGRFRGAGKKAVVGKVVKSRRQQVDAGVVVPEKAVVGKKLKMPKIPPKTGDSLKDALNNAVFVADRAFEEYLVACENKLSTIPLRLSEHSKALDARLKAERAYREEMERRGVLAEKGKILDAARGAIEEVLRRLNRLPEEAGQQCNPDNPMLATKILEREVKSLILAGKKHLDGLR